MKYGMMMMTVTALALGMVAAPAARAGGFGSIVCADANEGQGVTNLSLTEQPSGLYNLTISKVGGTPNDTYAGAVSCAAVSTGVGTLPLVECTRADQGQEITVTLGQVATLNWVDFDSNGTPTVHSTGMRYEWLVSNPFLANPFTQVYRFLPTSCHQTP